MGVLLGDDVLCPLRGENLAPVDDADAPLVRLRLLVSKEEYAGRDSGAVENAARKSDNSLDLI